MVEYFTFVPFFIISLKVSRLLQLVVSRILHMFFEMETEIYGHKVKLGQFLKTRKNEYKTGRCPARNKLCTLIEKSMILDKVYFYDKRCHF